MASKKRNRIEVIEDHALIHIYSETYGHIEAKIDLDCVDLVKDYCWCVVGVGCEPGKMYIHHRSKGTKRYLHQWILDTPKGLQSDHINGNTLDNRRCNLQAVDRSVNCANRGKPKNNTSGYKGVTITPAGNYRAVIAHRKANIHLGTFNTPEEAALAYNEGNRKYHGGVFQNVIV